MTPEEQADLCAHLDHLVEQARAHPDLGFAGWDVYPNADGSTIVVQVAVRYVPAEMGAD